jgi:nitrate reductase assembly molybdenum cofactor insertion protein NarJ
MRLIVAAGAALLYAAPAYADDASDCAAGIEMIKSEISKSPAADVLEKLNEALKDAEREAAEKQYDECFEAIDDAREAVAR